LAADLVGRKVDIIVTSAGGPNAVFAAKSATSTIPIVSVEKSASAPPPTTSGLHSDLGKTSHPACGE
jgi:hypothetical protein